MSKDIHALAVLNRSQGTQGGFKLSDLKMWLTKRGTVTLGGWLGSSPGTPWYMSVEFSFRLFLLGGEMLISRASSSHSRTVLHWGLLTSLLPACPAEKSPVSVCGVDIFAVPHYECLSFWFLTDWLKPFGSNQISHLPEWMGFVTYLKHIA